MTSSEAIEAAAELIRQAGHVRTELLAKRFSDISCPNQNVKAENHVRFQLESFLNPTSVMRDTNKTTSMLFDEKHTIFFCFSLL